MEAYKQQFLEKAQAAAITAMSPFPPYAACEAALESGFGTSGLAIADNNLFGMKQHVNLVYESVNLPTKEYLNGHWQVVQAPFVKYPDWAACFQDRLTTLKRLAHRYPHYAAALAATTGEEFIREVSRSWSTDPNRADKVLAITRNFQR